MIKVLIITNKSDLTSDFIVRELSNRNIEFYRFNTEELTCSIDVTLDFSKNRYTLYDKKTHEVIDLLSFSSVYYRRPELPALNNVKGITNSEMQLILKEITYTLEGIYKILKDAYWVSPIYSIREAENKIHQLILARKIGFNIPKSFISNNYDDVNRYFSLSESKNIIKPIKSGLVEYDNGESAVIFTSEINPDNIEQSELASCPIYLQDCVDKCADIRVTVVGEKVFAARIESQHNTETIIDWRKGENILPHSPIKIPIEIEVKCIKLIQALDLRFGAIDFVLTPDNEYIFLEINPNGQWAWIEILTKQKISAEIVNLLCNER